MYLNPFNGRWAFDAETADEVAKTWWIALIGGLVSIVFGVIVLAVDWSVESLAVFVGILFALQGVVWASSRSLDGSTRTGSLVLGGIGIATGIAVIVWPEIGLLTLAVFIGAWFVVSGALRIIGALANRHVPYWWLVLIVGLVEVPLGLWALRRPGMTLAILITLFGIWSILTGTWQCAIAFELRKLPQRIRGGGPFEPRVAV